MLDDNSAVIFRSINLSIYTTKIMVAPFLVRYHKNLIFFFFFLSCLLFSVHGLKGGSSLSVENDDNVLVSPNGLFTAGFHQVGENAYCFAVWFTDQPTTGGPTVVWMANRDAPVNGKYSKLILFEDGNLALTDAEQYITWSTHTKSTSSNSLQLELHDTGNLILFEGEQSLWQSFDYPTDTLLPDQPLTTTTQLASSRSSTNYASGFYKLFFDDYDSILRLHYEGPVSSSVFWPDPRFLPWEVGRYQYVYNRRASLNSDGGFKSSDGLEFFSADYGIGPQRMMKIDIDGNLRVYSFIEHQTRKEWQVQWQAVSRSCRVHGICGPNSLCTYSQDAGRRCICLHGYKMVNFEDWSYGCAPEFEGCSPDNEGFIKLTQAEFYGYDIRCHPNYTLDSCKKDCLDDCTCKGFQFSYDCHKGIYYCYMKNSLYNGYQMGFYNTMYIKLPKTLVSSFHQKTINEQNVSCVGQAVTPMIRSYEKKHHNKLLNSMAVLGCVIGFIEIIGIVFFWYKSSKHSITADQCYFPAATAFRKFTYSELKKASNNFSEEIGRGGTGVVYKGILSDKRIAAIKKLKNTNDHQGEDEFQAEISTIGRLNHMNLIETWGYCAEGKHRLIVYEYMENGSLAGNLRLGNLNWETRFEIAKGIAKGLAYLHEECLEWVLHCDVKPHNILLDANYNPKVTDFGLSKLFDRDRIGKSNFSTVRGTRGYMAPEWVFNLPITSKVDVFSYGVVILEMITGQSPTRKQQRSDENGDTEPALIDWVRDRINGNGRESWIRKIVNPSINGEYDRITMENLVNIALQCAEEDRKVRPTMKQVVNMLQHPENYR